VLRLNNVAAHGHVSTYGWARDNHVRTKHALRGNPGLEVRGVSYLRETLLLPDYTLFKTNSH